MKHEWQEKDSLMEANNAYNLVLHYRLRASEAALIVFCSVTILSSTRVLNRNLSERVSRAPLMKQS